MDLDLVAIGPSDAGGLAEKVPFVMTPQTTIHRSDVKHQRSE
jgi:hypothetical protein